jgi:small neutral amino acid transporter SnatA (MarC family)
MPVAEIFSAAVLLLLVIDPFGNVPIVVSAMLLDGVRTFVTELARTG